MAQKKSFQGGTFETGGFNICPTSKNVNTPFKDRLGGGLYIDIFSVKNVGIESIYRKMPYKKTLFLLYFWLLLGF